MAKNSTTATVTHRGKVLKMGYKPQPKEYIPGESVTVQNETRSIREILTRHANGLNFDNFKTPFYEDQATFSTMNIHELQKMDITDKIQYLTDLQQRTTALKAKIEDYKAEQDAQLQQNVVTTNGATNDDDSTTTTSDN